MKIPRFQSIILSALLASLALTGAYAQTTDTAAREDANKKSEDVTELDKIIVTTNRRAQTSQSVSGLVQTVSGEQLRKDGITELRQIQQAIPGMNIANQEGNVELYIRGVGSSNNTELGDPGAAPHLNGIYIPRPRGLGMMFFDIDRVEVNKGPQGTLYGRNAMAGTLNIITAKPKIGQSGGFVQGEVSNRSGRGAEAAFNVPLGDSAAMRGAVTYVNKDYGFVNHTAQVLASGAVTSPPPALLAAAGYKPAGLEKNYGGRLSFLWDPTDKLRLSAVLDAGRETGTGYPGANISEAVKTTGLRAENLDLRKVVYRGTEGDMTNKLWGVQAKIDYDVGPFNVEFNSSVRNVDFNQRNASSSSIDYPGRNYNAVKWDDYSSQYWLTKSRSVINELRLYADDPKSTLKWTGGLFNFKENQQTGFLSLADAGYCCYSGTEFTMPDVRGRSTAVYGDATWSLADSFRALGGLRYTRESKYRYGIGGNLALVLGGANDACCVGTRFGTEGFQPAFLNRPNFNVSGNLTQQQKALILIQSTLTPGARDTLIPQISAIANGTNPNGTCFTRPDIDNGFVTCATNTNGGFNYANLTIPGQQIGSSKANYGDFRLGFEWDLNKDQMLYGKVSSGHKAGGFNDSFKESEIPETFKPESLIVLETGIRNTFNLDGRRAVFNLTGFFYDYKDQIFQDLTCINFDATKPQPCQSYSLVNRNIGRSRLAGLEMETRLPLSSSIKLDLNGTFLQTKITKGELADFRAQSFDDNEFGRGRTPIISVVGNKLPLASKYSFAARLQQTLPVGGGKFDWQALLSYRSAYYLTPFNESAVVYLDPDPTKATGGTKTALVAGFPDRQRGFATLNLGLGYTIGSLRMEVFAANVTNEQASQKAIVGSGLNLRFLNDARSYGLRGRLDF